MISEATSKIHRYMQAEYNLVYNQRTYIHSSGSVAHIITDTRHDPSSIYLSVNLNKIMDYLTALNFSDETILDSVIFTSDGINAFSKSSSKTRDISLSYPFTDLPYIQDFENSEQNIMVIYEPAPDYLLPFGNASDNTGVISFIAKIYDTNQPAKRIILGYLMINLSLDSILDTYSEIGNSSNGFYYVVNDSGTIIYSNDAPSLGNSFENLDIGEEDTIFNKPVGISGIHVLGVISEKALQEEIHRSIIRMLSITIAGIAFMVCCITFLHKHYRRKFRCLAQAMENISQGDFKVRLRADTKDEIGYLSAAFNNMCETLDTYIKKTYVAETSRRTAELYALQAQINPHFLFNTIESIRMKSLSDGNRDVADMLSKLGNLFRWMIQFNQDIIYLEDEVDYIESYLELQKLRFGEKVQVLIDVPAAVLYFGIPKFTLQPIVENAIHHGIGTGTKVLEISICAAQEGQDMKILVEDTGRGMDNETLHRLQNHIYGKERDTKFGVALWNVHTRIQLLFGPPYGLTISSAPYQGTQITILLPGQPKKEMEMHVQDDYC